MVICVAPTASFGLLHPKLPLGENETLGINDVLRVSTAGTLPPRSGRRLVVLGWGPECKMAARVLEEEIGLACDFFVLNYSRVPNSLVAFFEGLRDDPVPVLRGGSEGCGICGKVGVGVCMVSTREAGGQFR
jgi:hypothetical protein